jgi:hypothetical protein
LEPRFFDRHGSFVQERKSLDSSHARFSKHGAVMSKQRPPKLFDLIAVLNSPSGSDLQIGDVGTVVELLAPNAVEAEFLDRQGRTRALVTLTFDDILVLNRERTLVA